MRHDMEQYLLKNADVQSSINETIQARDLEYFLSSDHLAALNILIVICGKYFGQEEMDPGSITTTTVDKTDEVICEDDYDADY
jgi:hypothetical protein